MRMMVIKRKTINVTLGLVMKESCLQFVSSMGLNRKKILVPVMQNMCHMNLVNDVLLSMNTCK